MISCKSSVRQRTGQVLKNTAAVNESVVANPKISIWRSRQLQIFEALRTKS